MTAVLERVEREALSLPSAERAFLADRLLSSLGSEVLNDVDAEWVAKQTVCGIQRGETATHSRIAGFC